MTTQQSTKAVRSIHRSLSRHWVGNGFPVQTLLSYSKQGAELSPFLLLDHAGPTEFPPTSERLGVGAHPHRGFETVTIVYSGEVEHRDSAGGGGTIGPGDVQWMTAASGLVHDEFHGREFARNGGTFEMVQLWVNLPARDKGAAPRYQALASAEIPIVALPGGAGSLRVIAGEYAGARGPARTFTPMHVHDLSLATDGPLEFDVPDGWTTALVVLDGTIELEDGETVEAEEVALFEPRGTRIAIRRAPNAKALLLSGEPIDEPIVGQGPFVMNTVGEIRQAMSDFASGRMGRL